MTKLPWKPWHQVVQLRPDLLSGDLPMAQFAADLYDVVMDRGTSVYRIPYEFFALTYPTYNLRELAKDVVHRLAGKSDKAIRQLELTYGGGKTHTEITLFHLVRDPASLPDLPAVHEFRQHIGMTPPQTRVVDHAVRQVRCRERNGGPQPGRRETLAPQPVERAGVPDRRIGRASAPSR